MSYFTDSVEQIVADRALTTNEKGDKLRVMKSQAADLLRAAGPSQSDQREQELEEIDNALSIIFPSPAKAR